MMKCPTHAFVSAALIALLASGCAGSSHALPATSPLAQATATASKSGTALFSLAIPNRPATSSSKRSAQYVSASTLSGTILVNATTTELDLGVSSPNCAPTSTGRACLISAPAPIGTQTFTLKLYDGAFSGGFHSGSVLSVAAGFNATVTEGTSNVPTPLVLSGVPTFYRLAIAQQPVAYALSGGSSTGTAVLTVYDHQMNVIVGPGTYETSTGIPSTFLLGASSNHANYSVALNGGGQQPTQTVTAPSDAIAFAQTHASLGAQLVITPSDSSLQQLGNSVFIRPTGFTTANVESALDASGASGSQLAPISEQSYGVAGLGNYSSPSIFTTGSGASTVTACSTGIVRQPDMAEGASIVWTIQSALTFTYDIATCSPNPQYQGATVAGVGSGIDVVNPDCTAGYEYPGVYEAAGTGAPSNCTGPHDVIVIGNAYQAAVYTNSSDSIDHVAIYDNGHNFSNDVPLTNSYGSAAAHKLVSLASRSDYIFGEDLGVTKRVWALTQAGSTVPGLSGFFPLPGSYTYVDNTYINPATVTWSNRTMAVGSDGLMYIAVSSPYNGVVVIDPSTFNVVTDLPNAASVSGQAPFNVVSDGRGSIYWSAGNTVMHYPSSIANT